LATALIRTAILYFLIMIGLRLTGKRQLGELEPGELVLTMMLSDLAAVPMQDFGLPLLAGVLPILILLSLSLLLSQLSLKSHWFRELACGRPTVIIDSGRICQNAMRRSRLTTDELLEELRLQGYSNLTSVKYAILENSGNLSVLPWTTEQPPTAAQMQMQLDDDCFLPLVLINDGQIMRKNLEKSGNDAAWLHLLLRDRGISSPSEVFLLTLSGNDRITCIRKEHA
jgi:uncharacterized membrane protein YcaP (DUF421 family)